MNFITKSIKNAAKILVIVLLGLILLAIPILLILGALWILIHHIILGIIAIIVALYLTILEWVIVINFDDIEEG